MVTKIEWVKNLDGTMGETWNPIVGCSKVSEGCQNCYAERMARRLKGMGLPQYQDIVDEHGWTGEIGYASERVWEKPLRWRKPRRVFVCSMGDLFHSGVNRDKQVAIWFTMERCPQHTFQVLTKRPENMRRFVTEVWSDYTDEHVALPNVWLGVTAENQDAANERIPALLATPAAVRFVSVEPMLGSVDLSAYLPSQHWVTVGSGPNVVGAEIEYTPGIDWAIIGCESGPGRRPMKPEWAIDLIDQCQAVGVPVFVKQIEVNGRVSHDPAEWPPELRVRQYPCIRHNQQED